MVVTLDLNDEQMARLERVCLTTGVEAAVAIADALAVYEDRLGDDDYRRHFTPEQIAAIEAGIEDVKHGRLIDHEDLMAEIKAKHGW